MLAVELQIRLHFKCQTNCVVNHSWFSISHFPPNDGFRQSSDECGEEELITHGIVGLSFSCKVTEYPVESGHILAREMVKGFELGPKNVGVLACISAGRDD